MDKKDIEGGLNELLGLNIHWSSLPKEDLEELIAFFGDDKRVIDTLGKEIIKERVGSRVDGLFKRARMYSGSGRRGIFKELLGK